MEDKIFSEFINKDLKLYFDILVCDDDFVEDIEKTKMFNSFKELDINARKEMLNNYICNTSRVFIMCSIVVKHIYKILLSQKDKFLDEYWKERFDRVDKNII